MIKEITHPEAGTILTRFGQQRILVVGDIMLDEVIWGAVHRISPEAPVPVVEVQERSCVPGGAGNTAANVAGLGAMVQLVGVVGDDAAGKRLSEALREQGVGVSGLVVDADRPTTTKTRVLAQGQHLLRLDHEQRGAFTAAVKARLLAAIESQLPEVDAVILSDYAKGVVSASLAAWLIQKATTRGQVVVVDPKGSDFVKYRGATVVKPNLHEAGYFLKRPVATEADVTEAGRGLLSELGVAGVLITRGAAGMMLFRRENTPVAIAAQAQDVYDVTGAGDTVAATLAVVLAAGADLEQAARLANRAAGVVVAKAGTAAVTAAELAGIASG